MLEKGGTVAGAVQGMSAFNPDNPLGREMMARQFARQFCRLGEVHSLIYGRRASGENGRKLTASTCVGWRAA